ncbi:MAG: helix-turn-helix domain-containing protein [Alistipes sp.]
MLEQLGLQRDRRAALLRERRIELHLTQEQLAQKVGKQRSYIARLERGNVDMQLSTMLAICSTLGFKFALTL